MSNQISYKNKLQEYCQKNNLPIPVYKSMSTGEPQNLEWHVEAIFDNRVYVANEFKTKKEAEQKVAEMILSNISIQTTPLSPPNKSRIQYDSSFSFENHNQYMKFVSYDTIVFVDLENVNLLESDIMKHQQKLFVVVTSKSCTKQLFQKNNVENIVCKFVGRDVADVLLIFVVGQVYEIIKNKNIFVYTKDHYGDTLGRIIGGHNICSLDELDA